MTTLSKTLLIISAIGFAVGSVVAFGNIATNNVGLLMAMPLGAIAFGVFLISLMMEKEMKQFDHEVAERIQRAERYKTSQMPKQSLETPAIPLSLRKAKL